MLVAGLLRPADASGFVVTSIGLPSVATGVWFNPRVNPCLNHTSWQSRRALLQPRNRSGPAVPSSGGPNCALFANNARFRGCHLSLGFVVRVLKCAVEHLAKAKIPQEAGEPLSPLAVPKVGEVSFYE